MTDVMFSVADLAGFLAGVLADEPYDLDEDQAVRWLNDAFEEDPSGAFDGVISGFVYMFKRHRNYTDSARDELIAAVHDEIAAIYEEE